MLQSRIRSLAAVGGLVMAGAALAGCGGGSGGSLAAGSADPPASSLAGTATTIPAPATSVSVPAISLPVPATTVPGPSSPVPVPATSVPAATGRPGTPAPPATPSTGPSGGGPVLIVRAFGGSVGYDGRDPSTIDFSRDSTNIVGHLTWSSWGPATAVGHGTLGLDDCQPNCAEGTVTQIPATIKLSGVVNGHFTAMTEKAGDLFRSYSYPSKWAVGAA